MKRLSIIVVLITGIMFSCRHESPAPTGGESRMLVFSRTAGYQHQSIAAGQQMFQQQADSWKLRVLASEGALSESELDSCDILVLLNSTGDVFSNEEQAALQTYVRKGGKVLAIHAAADAEYGWPWYKQMLGAWFDSHPAIQQANCVLTDTAHAAGKNMPATWTRTDEWYNFKEIEPGIQVIYRLDEGSYSGGTNGVSHPISWCHSFEGGKIFYTGMGHTAETYSEPLFIQHISGAIEWLRTD